MNVALTWSGIVRQIRAADSVEDGVELLRTFFRKRKTTYMTSNAQRAVRHTEKKRGGDAASTLGEA